MCKGYCLYLLLSLLGVVSCGQSDVLEKIADTGQTLVTEETSNDEQDYTLTDTLAIPLACDSAHRALGCFLGANQAVSPGDPNYRYTLSSTYAEFKSTMDDVWTRVDRKKETMQKWAKSELSDVHESNGTLFYPFSGADLLHADLFFPQFDTLLFFALEPAGSIPELSTLYADENLDAYLKGLHKSLQDILNLSFFRTKVMQVQFKENVDGTLPLFLHFISRTGHELLSIEPVTLAVGGKVIPRVNDTMNYPVGYRFSIRNMVNEKQRVIYYFACNFQDTSFALSDSDPLMPGLANDSTIIPFLVSQHIKATYLKSASYLLHRRSFSIMRQFILDYSSHIIQDDSGIPFKYFDESLWSVTLFGSYSAPIPLFAERFEEDLHAAYREGSLAVRNLPFGIGYNSMVGTSNMLYARKLQKLKG